jgi:hypothetical protein
MKLFVSYVATKNGAYTFHCCELNINVEPRDIVELQELARVLEQSVRGADGNFLKNVVILNWRAFGMNRLPWWKRIMKRSI